MEKTELLIPSEKIKEAIEKHEKNFQKELESVDIRAVVLKTKKAVLEQAFRNSTMESHVISLKHTCDNLKRENDFLKSRISFLEENTKNITKIVIDHVNDVESRRKRSPVLKFWDFIKCLMK